MTVSLETLEAKRISECFVRRPGNPIGSCGLVDVAVGHRVGLHLSNCDKCWEMGPATEAAGAYRATLVITARPKRQETKSKGWTTWPGKNPWPLGLNQWQGFPWPRKLWHFLRITRINSLNLFKRNCDGSCGCWRPTYTLWTGLKTLWRKARARS